MGAAALEGFLLGAGLIIAIGAQNAYVLGQGIARRHVFAVTTICFLSDALLIAAGVAGFGTIVRTWPTLVIVVTIFGAVFLVIYGALALNRARRHNRLESKSDGAQSLAVAVTTVLALTWLNPHVYLDTVLMLGGISARYDGGARAAFGAGAAFASFVWFYGLGYGAALLAPIFRNPNAWRVLDIVIGLVMWAIAASLIAGLA